VTVEARNSSAENVRANKESFGEVRIRRGTSILFAASRVTFHVQVRAIFSGKTPGKHFFTAQWQQTSIFDTVRTVCEVFHFFSRSYCLARRSFPPHEHPIKNVKTKGTA
jgi:hypothetical protein